MHRKLTEEECRAVGAGIRRARDNAGWTQEMLAHAIGSGAASWISKVETGRDAPSLALLFDIAEVLDLRVADLLDIERPLSSRPPPGPPNPTFTLYETLPTSGQQAVDKVVRELAAVPYGPKPPRK